MLEIGFGTILQTTHRDFPQGCPTTCRLCPLTQLECEAVISILSPHWRQGLFFIHTRSCLPYRCHIRRGEHFANPHKFYNPGKYQYSSWNSNFYMDENYWHPSNSLSMVQRSALLPSQRDGSGFDTQLWLFCAAFACSPCAGVSSHKSRDMPVWWIDQSKLTICVNVVCLCVSPAI